MDRNSVTEIQIKGHMSLNLLVQIKGHMSLNLIVLFMFAQIELCVQYPGMVA